MKRDDIRRLTLIILLAALAAGVCVARFATEAGVPAFQQDWLWPVSRAQCSAYLLTGLLPWHSGGSGYPSAYPEPWWPYLTAGTLCSAFGPHLSVLIFVAGCIFVSALTMYAFARRCGHAPIGAGVALLLYALNPVVFNEIQAGHVLFLSSYALLPAVGYLALPALIPAQWLVLGAAMGAASAQQQFLVLGAMLATACASSVSWRWALATVLPAILTAVAFTSPQWILATVEPHAFAAVRPLPHWELAQSARLADALRTIGYIGGYDAGRLGVFVHWLLWAVPVAAFAAAIVGRRDAITRAVTVLGASALAVVWGIYGPLGAPLHWGFAHVFALAAFRELYNFSALLVLAYATLIPGLLRKNGSRKLMGLRIAGCITVILASLLTGYQSFAGIPIYNPGPQADAYLARASAAAAWGRFTTVPGTFPQSMHPGAAGGLSPYLISAGPSASALSPFAVYPNAYLTARLLHQAQNHRFHTAPILRILGVGAIVHVPGIATASNEEPALKSLFPPPPVQASKGWSIATEASSMVAVVPYRYDATTLTSIEGDADLRVLEGGKPLDLFSRVTNPDPHLSWVIQSQWPMLPEWTYAVPDGIFTISRAKKFSAPPALFVAGDATGHLHSPECVRSAKLDEHFAVYDCNGNPVFYGKPPLVISDATAGARLRRPVLSTGSAGVSTIQTGLPFLYRVQINARAGSALVLRQRFDALWTADVPAKHIPIDGFANAWILDKAVSKTVSIYYRGALAYYAALALSVGLAVAAIMLAARQRFIRR